MEHTNPPLPKPTDHAGWMRIFPEALRIWGPRVKKYYQNEILFKTEELRDRKACRIIDIKTNKYPWRDELILEAAERDIVRIQKELRHAQWKLDEIKELLNPTVGELQNKTSITDSMIERARQYPLDRLIDINRAGFARCIWHTDTHPSMFCKKNFAHCFSCNKSGDTIKVLMDRDGLTFREAVMRLQ